MQAMTQATGGSISTVMEGFSKGKRQQSVDEIYQEIRERMKKLCMKN